MVDNMTMPKVVTEMIAFVTFFIAFYGGVGSAFLINVSPDKLDPIAPDDVRISCTMSRDDYMVKDVVKIEVTKGQDETIATLDISQLTYGTHTKTIIQGKGDIYSIPTDSYLELTLSSPSFEDIGTYSCLTYYMDDIGEQKVETVTANLHLDYPKITKYVSSLVRKAASIESELVVNKYLLNGQAQKEAAVNTDLKQDIASLKAKNKKLREKLLAQANKLQSQKKELDEQQLKVKDQTDKDNQAEQRIHKLENPKENQSLTLLHLMEKDNQAVQNIDTLENESKNQSVELLSLIEKDNQVSAFTAGYAGKIDYYRNRVIIFDEPVMSVGQGYNKKTGVYTAPTDGLYSFQLTVMSKEQGEPVESSILVNKKLVAATYGGEIDNTNSVGSTNAAVPLKRGDQVWARVRFFRIKDNVFHWPYSIFTGHLVKAS